jgi:hypothetical protein
MLKEVESVQYSKKPKHSRCDRSLREADFGVRANMGFADVIAPDDSISGMTGVFKGRDVGRFSASRFRRPWISTNIDGLSSKC